MTVRTEALVMLGMVIAISAALAKGLHSLLRTQPRARRAGIAIGLSVMCVPGLWFSIYYLHVLPENEWLYRLRAARFSELWFCMLLPAATAWGSLVPNSVAIFLRALALPAVMVPFFKPIYQPLDASRLLNQWRGDACLQSTESTCGPSSSATVMKYLGNREMTESRLALEAWSSASGTEAWYLARALRKEGREVNFEFNGLPAPDHLPGVLGVKLGNFGHFIAVLKSDGQKWTIADPLNGEETLEREELEQRYTITPFFMRIR